MSRLRTRNPDMSVRVQFAQYIGNMFTQLLRANNSSPRVRRNVVLIIIILNKINVNLYQSRFFILFHRACKTASRLPRSRSASKPRAARQLLVQVRFPTIFSFLLEHALFADNCKTRFRNSRNLVILMLYYDSLKSMHERRTYVDESCVVC